MYTGARTEVKNCGVDLPFQLIVNIQELKAEQGSLKFDPLQIKI